MAKKIPILVLLLIVTSSISYLIWKEKYSPFYYAATIEMEKTEISARLPSIIDKVYVKEGHRVTKGQTLLDLNCDDIKLSQLMAKQDFDRAEKLFKSGSYSQELYQHAQNRLAEQNLKMSWCHIVSPLDTDGIITDVYKNPGEMVTAGTPLLRLLSTKESYAYFYIPATLLSKISVGMEVEGIIPEISGKIFKGKVSKINEEAEFTPKNVQTRSERTRLVYGVKVYFDNSEGILKAGMPIESLLLKNP